MTHATVFGKIDSYQIIETGALLASRVRNQDVNINIIKCLFELFWHIVISVAGCGHGSDSSETHLFTNVYRRGAGCSGQGKTVTSSPEPSSGDKSKDRWESSLISLSLSYSMQRALQRVTWSLQIISCYLHFMFKEGETDKVFMFISCKIGRYPQKRKWNC